MYYLDSNIFILPALFEGERAEKAKDWLKMMVKGEIEAATSVLTLDEIVWVISREAERKNALVEGERVLEFPHLKLLDVKTEDGVRMINYQKRYGSLKPRDAVHLSVALRNGIHTIVSDDDDFEDVDGVEWEGLL